jgi:integrase
MAGRLKAIKLATLEPGMHSDGNGLYLAVGEFGSRSWILRTMVRGKRCEIGLGSLATTGLAEARVEAATLRARARKNEDILEDRRKAKEETQRQESIPSFEAAAKEYHGTLKETFSSEDHAYNWLQSLELHVFPVFGKKTVDKIDSADVLAAIGPMWTEKGDTAGRTLRRIKKIFDYCAVKHWRMLANPCDVVRAALPKRNNAENHHEALRYPELPAFIQSLRTSQSALAVKLAFEFLILTCSRTSEVLNATWEEFDLKEAVWTVPGERMKMKRPHMVPLSPRCIEILNLAKEFNDSAIVFPGRYEGKPLSNMAFLMALRRMKHDDLTAHGFRATFKTWSEEKTKFDSLVIEAAMAHVVRGIERHYLRTTFFEERKKLMNAWTNFATGKPAAKVVRMRT